MSKAVLIFTIILSLGGCSILITENSLLPLSNKEPLEEYGSLVSGMGEKYPNYKIEQFTLRMSDGLKIRGLYLLNRESLPKTTIYFLGGSGSLISERADKRLSRLLLTKQDVVWFDYRGYGLSDRYKTDVSLERILLDSEEVYDYLKLNVRTEKVIVHGISAGGVIATYLGGARNLDGEVIQSATADLQGIIDHSVPNILKLLLKVEVDKRLEQVLNAENEMLKRFYENSMTPVYFITNEEDKTIDKSLVIESFEKSESSKKLLCVSTKVMHGDELESDNCMKLYFDFLNYIN